MPISYSGSAIHLPPLIKSNSDIPIGFIILSVRSILECIICDNIPVLLLNVSCWFHAGNIALFCPISSDLLSDVMLLYSLVHCRGSFTVHPLAASDILFASVCIYQSSLEYFESLVRPSPLPTTSASNGRISRSAPKCLFIICAV